MGKIPSLHGMIEGLKTSVAFHQNREAFHAQQEAHHAHHQKLHMEQKTHHAKELANAIQHLAELQGMAERLGEVVAQAVVAPAETDEQIFGRHPNVSKALDLVLATWPPDVTFTASTLAAEVSRRYAAALRRTVPPRVIAAALRRRRDDRIVDEVREGRPFQEAVYRKRGA
jgi:hypothetical protein